MDRTADREKQEECAEIARLLVSIPSEEKGNVISLTMAFIAGMEAQRTLSRSEKPA